LDECFHIFMYVHATGCLEHPNMEKKFSYRLGLELGHADVLFFVFFFDYNHIQPER
jgi:hypothetical protein